MLEKGSFPQSPSIIVLKLFAYQIKMTSIDRFAVGNEKREIIIIHFIKDMKIIFLVYYSATTGVCI